MLTRLIYAKTEIGNTRVSEMYQSLIKQDRTIREGVRKFVCEALI